MTVVVITGASRGLGATTARRLAAQGVTVFAGARQPAELVEHLRVETPDLDIRPLALDVTDDASVEAAVRQVRGATGGIDVLINNAGISGSRKPANEVRPDDMRPVFETNVFGIVRVTQAFLPLLRQGNRPRLVMVSSGVGSFGLLAHGGTYERVTSFPYPASKAAVNLLTLQYAKGLPDVIVTAIDPGYTATEFTNHAGTQSVEEGTDAIVTAALDVDGPSGRFLDRHGVTPW